MQSALLLKSKYKLHLLSWEKIYHVDCNWKVRISYILLSWENYAMCIAVEKSDLTTFTVIGKICHCALPLKCKINLLFY